MLIGWFGHFIALAAYTAAHWLLAPLRRLTSNYYVQRWLDVFEYGAGLEHGVHKGRRTTVNPSPAAARAGGAGSGGGAGAAGFSPAEGVASAAAAAGAKGSGSAQQQQPEAAPAFT